MTQPNEGDVWKDDNGDWLKAVKTTAPDTSWNHRIRIEGDEEVCINCHKRWGKDDPDMPPCD